MKPFYVSFYTAGTEYEVEAARLGETLRRFDLDHDIVAVDNAGSWERNCARKPGVVLAAMERHRGRSVVWIDADARVLKYPVLFDDLDCDIAYHRKDGWELLSGTLYFGPAFGAWEIVRAWDDACKSHPDEWDQQVLDSVLLANPGRWNVADLPVHYVAIVDIAHVPPRLVCSMCPVDSIVIKHTQAARRLKKAVQKLEQVPN